MMISLSIVLEEERLLAAARSDNEELLLEVFEQPGTFDINCQDGCVVPCYLRLPLIFVSGYGVLMQLRE